MELKWKNVCLGSILAPQKPGTMVNAFNTITWELEVGGSEPPSYEGL